MKTLDYTENYLEQSPDCSFLKKALIKVYFNRVVKIYLYNLIKNVSNIRYFLQKGYENSLKNCKKLGISLVGIMI